MEEQATMSYALLFLESSMNGHLRKPTECRWACSQENGHRDKKQRHQSVATLQLKQSSPIMKSPLV